MKGRPLHLFLLVHCSLHDVWMTKGKRKRLAWKDWFSNETQTAELSCAVENNYRKQPRERVRTKERGKHSSSAAYFIENFSTWVNLWGIRNTLVIVDCIQIQLGIEHIALNIHKTVNHAQCMPRRQFLRDQGNHIV